MRHVSTHSILVTCLSTIDVDAAHLFARMLGSLEAQGHKPGFWSTARHPDLARWQRASSWDLGRWPALWPDIDWSGARAFVDAHMHEELDVSRWATRVARLVKQSDAAVSSLGLSRLEANYVVARHLLDASPELGRFVAWNASCPHAGIAAELAGRRGIEVLTLERGYLPGTWMVDRGGLMGHSSLAAPSLEALSKRYDIDLDTAALRGRSILGAVNWDTFVRHAQPQKRVEPSFGEGARPKIVVLGSDDVSNALVPHEHPDRRVTSPDFRSSAHLAVAVARCRPDAQVCFKPHPSMAVAADAGDAHGEPWPANLSVVDVDFRELLSQAQLCVTLGSTTGFVALAMGCPLVVAAREVLSGKGVAHEALHPETLATAVERGLRRAAWDDQRQRFEALVGILDHAVLLRRHEGTRLASHLLTPP